MEEDNLNYIAEQIFSKPPEAPNSIQLQLEEQTADIAEQEGASNFIFNILFIITFKGIEKLYGHKNIMELTERQYETICSYVASYGYKLQVYANDTFETPWEILNSGRPLYRYKIFFDKLY